MYKHFGREDPAPKSQHALPNTTVEWVAANMWTGRPRDRVTSYLVVLAYFYLLRVGEYTPEDNRTRDKQTIPLRKCDVQILRNGRPLDRNAPLETLLSGDGVTICLENQKNGIKDQSLFHDASGRARMCPKDAMAYLLNEVRGLPDDTPLGSFISGGKVMRVRSADVRGMVRLAAVEDGLDKRGYDLQRIGSHSLRSGGAVRLKIAGADDALIMKLGRWSSKTWMKYIQPHISAVTRGLAARMAIPLRFWNVHVR